MTAAPPDNSLWLPIDCPLPFDCRAYGGILAILEGR
jgi:hypothetical protein